MEGFDPIPWGTTRKAKAVYQYDLLLNTPVVIERDV